MQQFSYLFIALIKVSDEKDDDGIRLLSMLVMAVDDGLAS